MRDDIEADISRALDVAADCEKLSDEAFASGRPIDGFRLYRWRCLAMTWADSLMQRLDTVGFVTVTNK